MKLYSGPLSLFTAKIRIGLEEKGLDHERIEVGWSPEARYEPHHPDVVALNPKRQVPVLVDGDVVVYDSTLIFEYLEDRYPEPPLLPSDAAGRARARQLEASADEIFFPRVWDLIEEVFYPADAGGRTEGRAAAAIAALGQQYAELDKTLAAGPYLCGDLFGTADIATFVFTNAATTLGAPPDDGLAAFQAWLARVRERPSVQREMAATAAFLQSLGS